MTAFFAGSGDEIEATVLLVLLLRGALTTVFLVSVLTKLADRAKFIQTVRNYGVLPERLVRPFAYGVLLAESLVVLGLLVGYELSLVLFAVAGMLTLFSMAVAINVVRGRSFDCGCSITTRRSAVSWRHSISNLLIAGACVLAALRPTGDSPFLPSSLILLGVVASTGLVIAERWLNEATPSQVWQVARSMARSAKSGA